MENPVVCVVVCKDITYHKHRQGRVGTQSKPGRSAHTVRSIKKNGGFTTDGVGVYHGLSVCSGLRSVVVASTLIIPLADNIGCLGDCATVRSVQPKSETAEVVVGTNGQGCIVVFPASSRPI